MGKSPLDKTVMFVCIRFTLPLQIPDLCCPEYSHQFSGVRRHVRLSTLYLFRSNYLTFTDLTTLHFTGLRCGFCRSLSPTPLEHLRRSSVHVSSVLASKNFVIAWRRTNHISISQGQEVIDRSTSYIVITSFYNIINTISMKRVLFKFWVS